MVGGGQGTVTQKIPLDKSTGFPMLSALPVVLFGFMFCILVRGYNL